LSYSGATSFSASSSSATSLTITNAPPPATITVHGTLPFTTAHQTIAGFGGAEAFDLTFLDQHPNKAQIYTALFDPIQGLGLTFLRVQNLYYQYTGSNATTFDLDTPAIVQAANAAHGSPLKILMSSWSPPAAIKADGVINGNGSNTQNNTLKMVSGAYDYADFAQYWHDAVAAYEALGVTPDYISIQNEPDFNPSGYAACLFNPSEAPFYGTSYASYPTAFDAVYQKLQTLGSPPKMVGPENFTVSNVPAWAANIPANEIAAYAHHGYGVSSNGGNPDGVGVIAALQTMASTFPTQAKWETEYYQKPGFDNAWDIHNALVYGNDSAYFYWQLAWNSGSGGFSGGQEPDQQGVIYVDNPYSNSSTWAVPGTGWAYNDSYYALKHFSYFVTPGLVRYDAAVDNTNERISAYQSADKKKTVIEILNTSSTATDGITLDLSNVGYTSSTVYRSTFSTPITSGERMANLGPYPSSGIQLGPQSIVTVVLTNP
jgi:glucuronoarabinoxylan endo-1,4-beta-xylanase